MWAMEYWPVRSGVGLIVRRVDTGVDGVAVGAGLEGPAMFVGLAAVEAGELDARDAVGEAAGEDVEGDVGGVFLVVAERGDGIFAGGLAMRVGGGADGGVADGRGVEAEERVGRELEVVEGGDFHEEVVGVLAVDDGVAVGGFALLKELGVVAAADGGGLEGEHGAEGEFAAAAVGAELRWAMGMIQLVEKKASRLRGDVGLLLGVGGEGVGVEHESPGAVRRHEHGDGRGGGLDAGAGGAVLLDGFDEGARGHDHRGLRVVRLGAERVGEEEERRTRRRVSDRIGVMRRARLAR